MSHEITEFDSMFSADGITPWHRLGHVAEGSVKLAEGLKLAGLDWGIEKRQLTFTKADGTQSKPLDNKVALVRTDIEIELGVVAPTYEVFDNIEGFDVLDELLGRGDVELATAGSLMSGRRVWALAKLDRKLVLPGNDVVHPYMLAAFGHDGHFGIRYGATPVRVVCNNTLSWALKDTQAFWSAYHTKNVRQTLEDARRIIGLTSSYYDSFEQEVEALAAKRVSDKQFTNLLGKVFPLPKDKSESKRKATTVQMNRDAVRAIYAESKTVGDFRGTGWGAVQAFSTWDLWKRPVRGLSKLTVQEQDVQRDEAQAKRLLNGNADAFIHGVRTKVLALS